MPELTLGSTGETEDVVRDLLAKQDPFTALEYCEAGLKQWQNAPGLQRLKAACYLQCGSVQQAYQTIVEVSDLSQNVSQKDVFETRLILTKCLTGLVKRENQGVAAASISDLSSCVRSLYTAARTPEEKILAVLNGSQAACWLFLHDEQSKAAQIIRNSRTLLSTVGAMPGEESSARFNGALASTRCALLEGNWTAFEVDLRMLAGSRDKDLKSPQFPAVGDFRRDWRAVLAKLGRPETLLEALPQPPVVIFTGHMMDRPNRSSPRFPVVRLPEVEAAVEARVKEFGAVYGYASGACGGDILFHEAVLRAGGNIHITLPCPVEEFKTACIQGFEGGDWSGRFDQLWRCAAQPLIVGMQCANDNAVASEFCNRVMVGLARLKARSLDAPIFSLTVWDGQPGDAAGGTASMIRRCKERKIPEIEITSLRPAPTQSVQSVERGGSNLSAGTVNFDPPQKICAMVFADAAKFSRLTERQYPRFVDEYLAEVASLLERLESAPLHVNTWGDGLFAVFDSARVAVDFVVQLRDFVAAKNWSLADLPPGFGVRIALHAGPAYRIHDPVIKQTSYLGAHVNYTARIEPQTPINQVYCSQEFAALAMAEGLDDLRLEYVGRVQLAKSFGAYPCYAVEPKR